MKIIANIITQPKHPWWLKIRVATCDSNRCIKKLYLPSFGSSSSFFFFRALSQHRAISPVRFTKKHVRSTMINITKKDNTTIPIMRPLLMFGVLSMGTGPIPETRWKNVLIKLYLMFLWVSKGRQLYRYLQPALFEQFSDWNFAYLQLKLFTWIIITCDLFMNI